MTTTPKPCTMPEEIFAEYDQDGCLCAYDQIELGAIKYIRADLVEKMEGQK